MRLVPSLWRLQLHASFWYRDRAMIGSALLKVVPAWAWIIAGALVVTAVSGYHLSAISSAKKAGIEQDKKRSDAVINAMIVEHAIKVSEANAKVDAIETAMRLAKEGAERALRAANEANRNIRAAFAVVTGERDQLRDAAARAAIVTGGVQASDDSVAACRDRAERTWLSLEAALRTSRTCAGHAEDASAGVRGLQAAWPVAN